MATAQEEMTGLAGKYMTFKLDHEVYGLEILNVREIIRVLELTRMPRSKSYLRGVINLRGKVIPVVDLRVRFDMTPAETTDQSVIIVIQHEPALIGILVDEVLEVISVDESQIEPRPTFGMSTRDTEFLLGIGKVDKRVVFLLDITEVLTDDEHLPLPSPAAAMQPEQVLEH